MDAWLEAALEYLPRWIELQMGVTAQPGCVVAVSQRGRIILEKALGVADEQSGEKLTPRHRFRVASHSKAFTAAAILKLREEKRVRLDDPIGQFVEGLHAGVASRTVQQLLSHHAGLTRDGDNAGQWVDRRPFFDERGLRQELTRKPVFEANERFKYSNHGYGLLGLAIEAISGEPYSEWIQREIVAASGLKETSVDGPPAARVRFASGHSSRLPLGRRVVIPGRNETRAMAPATGFISSAADLARFFGSLDPRARRSVLSPASRRELVRAHVADLHMSVPRGYGLGVMSGEHAGWEWFGHGGAFQGSLSRTAVLKGRDLSVSIATNAIDGPATPWVEGAMHILQTFSKRGAPSRRSRNWTGRWWSLWRAVDLVPMGDAVLIADPKQPLPFLDASELRVDSRDEGTLTVAPGLGNPGELARRKRSPSGRVTSLRLGGIEYHSQASFSRQLKRRFES